MVVADYIEQNIDVFSKMVKIGAVPPSYFNYYKIYAFYRTTDQMKSKMDRYYFTSDSMKTNTTTVQKAIKLMESRV